MKKRNKELEKRDSVKIVPMLLSDIPEIKRIETESGLSIWSEVEYRKELERKDSIALVARRIEEVIGFLIARLIIQGGLTEINTLEGISDGKREENRSELEIYNLAVKESYRRNRIGEKLLSECLRRGKEREAREFWLEVRESNAPAIEFYRKAGFTVIYRRRNFYREPPEDALVMRLVFEETLHMYGNQKT